MVYLIWQVASVERQLVPNGIGSIPMSSIVALLDEYRIDDPAQRVDIIELFQGLESYWKKRMYDQLEKSPSDGNTDSSD